MKQIKMIIDTKTGKVTVSTSGYSGPACIQATKSLEAKLGIQGGEHSLTTEFYEQTDSTNQYITGQNEG